MIEKELIEWFNEKLMNCYHIVKDSGDVIWVYDKNYIRKLKLAEIDGREVESPVYDKNKVLFYQDQKNKMFDCDSDKIWAFLEENYSPNYHDIQSFIKSRLETIQNLKQFTPYKTYRIILETLETIQNLKEFTPESVFPLDVPPKI